MTARNPDRQLSPDVLLNLERSRRKAEQTATRIMHCPYCGFKIAVIAVSQKDIVFARCRKCKFQGALDPAYFRRMRAYREAFMPARKTTIR